MASVTVNWVVYDVLETHDADHHEARGLRRTAEVMRDEGYRDLICKRPKGRKLYLIRESTRHINAEGEPYRSVVLSL